MVMPLSIPEISHENDIYHVGSLCNVQAHYDKNNPLSPYMLTVAHMQKAKITEGILFSFLSSAYLYA